MHTNQTITFGARSFRRRVKVALVHRGWTVSRLAKRIGKHRNSTSRAINRGEFPDVQEKIRRELGL